MKSREHDAQTAPLSCGLGLAITAATVRSHSSQPQSAATVRSHTFSQLPSPSMLNISDVSGAHEPQAQPHPFTPADYPNFLNLYHLRCTIFVVAVAVAAPPNLLHSNLVPARGSVNNAIDGAGGTRHGLVLNCRRNIKARSNTNLFGLARAHRGLCEHVHALLTFPTNMQRHCTRIRALQTPFTPNRDSPPRCTSSQILFLAPLGIVANKLTRNC